MSRLFAPWCLTLLSGMAAVSGAAGLADETQPPATIIETAPAPTASAAVDAGLPQPPSTPVPEDAMVVPAEGALAPAHSIMVTSAWTPPGTLGETYTRPSHPIPEDKHPRTAMLAVRDNDKSPVLTVQQMGGFRMKSGVWLFESSRPLDFGACHIVRVEARRTPKDIEPYATKFVRLIPGRIVYLDF